MLPTREIIIDSVDATKPVFVDVGSQASQHIILSAPRQNSTAFNFNPNSPFKELFAFLGQGTFFGQELTITLRGSSQTDFMAVMLYADSFNLYDAGMLQRLETNYVAYGHSATFEKPVTFVVRWFNNSWHVIYTPVENF